MRTIINCLIVTLFFSLQQVRASNHISFSGSCIKGKSIIIAAVGDILLHTPLQKKGNELGFTSLWQEAITYFKKTNIVYANLEGPVAAGINAFGSFVGHNNPNVYTSYPAFNYPPGLIKALKNSGVDIVSTANNHALDRFSIGVDKTITLLDQVGIAHVGTQQRQTKKPWYHIVSKDGFKIAWIACTEHTNDQADTYRQVLHCYYKNDRKLILKTVQQLKYRVDAVIVSPHWGEEYQSYPNNEQVNFAHQVLDAGATAVIGSHPHVLQPLQKYVTVDGRETFIMYSLGNFVSNQSSPKTRATVILLFGLTKTDNGMATINGVRFVPMYMENNKTTNSLHLSVVPPEKLNDSTFPILYSMLPSGNVLNSSEINLNPACFTASKK